MPWHDVMAAALYNPEHGYYMQHVTLGERGDFVTAPSLTLAFGACVGQWVLKMWRALGQPAAFVLCEFGAGEGQLLQGLLAELNKTEAGQACRKAAHVHIVEISPRLQAAQQEKLKEEGVIWCEESALPTNAPLVVLANEVLDAFPVHILRKKEGEWEEEGLNEQGETLWRPCEAVEGWQHIKDGAIVEISEAQEAFVKRLSARINTQKGAVWLADYGYESLPPEGGETLQAVKGHKKISRGESVGEADITAHVDFGRVAAWLGKRTVLKNQADWLLAHGMLERGHEMLAAGEEDALHRLLHPARMGRLFKVLEYGPCLG